MVLCLMVRGLGPRGSNSCISPHPSCPTAACYVPGAHGPPADIYHQQLETFGRFRRSLQLWKIDLLKDSVCGDALDAVMTDLTSDIT
jgi:hypothetical protein